MLIERAYTLETANRRWDDEIKSLGLSIKSDNIGTTQHPIYLCSLTHNDTHTIGHGKGPDKQSAISAKFEALEHFLTSHSGACTDDKLISYKQVIKDSLPVFNNKIPADLVDNSELHDYRLPWVRFTSYAASNQYFYVPLVSVCCSYLENVQPDDKFPYHEIYINFGENGTAIGCCKEEALVHSILEVIERDAWSFFILRVFLQEQYEYIKLINISSVSPTISEYVNQFEKEYMLEVLLFELDNDFDVFTFGAAITIPGHPLGIKGFGASLNKQHAAERALYEVIQDYFVYLDTTRLVEVKTYNMLSSWPKIQE